MLALPIHFASDWFSGCRLTLFWPKRCKKSIPDFWKSFSSLTSNTFVPAPPPGGNVVGLRGPRGGSRGHRLMRVSGRQGHLSRFKGVRWKSSKSLSRHQTLGPPTLGPPTSSFCNVNKCSYSLSHCWCFLLFQMHPNWSRLWNRIKRRFLLMLRMKSEHVQWPNELPTLNMVLVLRVS